MTKFKRNRIFVVLLSCVLTVQIGLSGCSYDTKTPDTVSETGNSNQSYYQMSENLLTNEYLISLIIVPEIALVGDNSFMFEEPSNLSSQELYMLYLALTEYHVLEKAWDSLDDMFYFPKDMITTGLAKYFKDIDFKITEVRGYDEEKDVVATSTASGFGGDRFMRVSSKSLENNIITFVVDFYDEKYQDVYQTKIYKIEFYDGGYYYLSVDSKSY